MSATTELKTHRRVSTELKTLQGLSKQCWLTKDEQARWRDVIKRWKNENPNASAEKEILIEGLVRCHIWEQRLIDKRYFFNGDKTDYRVEDGRKCSDLSDEDKDRKDKEWFRYMPLIQQWKVKYLQLALANNIEVKVVNDISSLFGALDKQRKGLDGEEE
jgi:hypothetical protein